MFLVLISALVKMWLCMFSFDVDITAVIMTCV